MSKLFIRGADQVEVREVLGTEGANYPMFSPDGRWLAFVVNDEIYRVEVTGGPVFRVAEGSHPHWGLDDVLVFDRGTAIYSVSPWGGEPTTVLSSDSLGPLRPFLLPDGDAVVFQVGQGFEVNLMLVEIGSRVVTDLDLIGAHPQYVSTGHLLFGHGRQALIAAPFDLDTHSVTGEPATVLPAVWVSGGGATQFAVSETGTAIYGLPTGGAASRRLVVVDTGAVETPLPVGGTGFWNPRFSPSGWQIAYEGISDLFVYDLDKGRNRAIATSDQSLPRWSRDGLYVYYSDRGMGTDGFDGFRQLADWSEEAEQLYRRDDDNFPLSMSLDGTQILVMENTQDRGWDLVIMSEDGDNVIFTDYLRADWNETMASISPDGAWAAYVSDQSNIPEVYVSSFPDAEDRVRVSDGGGTEPVWTPDGSAIYYRSGSSLMKASITPGAGFSVDTPDEMFVGAWTPQPRRGCPPDELRCAPGRRVIPVREPAGSRTYRGRRRCARHAPRTGRELVRGTPPADGELKPQIPWLRVFVEGVLIVGSILLAFAIQARWERPPCERG